MEPSKVGIFYLLNGRIWTATAPVATIESSGGIRTYPRQHFDLWSDLQRQHSDLADLDCYSLPRGRVLYNELSRSFDILADSHILEKDFLVARIIEEFCLDASKVEIKDDDHYRCAVCKNRDQP